MSQNTKLVLGILAHVDAGKTTLAESILYLTGSIRKLGRVDHRDAFLDTYELERQRGITIFSKQAEVLLGEREVTLLDTPGHVDFSAEMERTLQVLDYAVLVISGADGVQGHVQTLWQLLKKYQIPVFIFINKMDQPDTDKGKLLEELKNRLDEHCVEFGRELSEEAFLEELAVCDEALLEKYLEEASVTKEEICGLIAARKVFPCYFGSALKIEGVKELLQGIEEHARVESYPEEFGARVYKIGRDNQGTRLTYLKITGGSLKVKQTLSNRGQIPKGEEDEIWEEKADQIRIYSGSSYTPVNEAAAGTVCAVSGLSKTFAGEGLGFEGESEKPILEPVLTYQIVLPEDCDVHQMLLKLQLLEEEEPQLHIVWNERLSEIHAQVMGEVQIEILKSLIKERFGVTVEFGSGSILYKETIKEAVEGVGHFEPLRHYAEVHLLLEPGERGSGLQFEADISEDDLDRNWQRLIYTHLEEKHHLGVLTGSEITDMKISLLAGRSHIKHTEGGDFRQSTYRAIRQGLMMAESVLLEPVYEFRLELPSVNVGRAMNDIQKMQGSFSSPELEGENAILCGSAPVVNMRGYQSQVTAYTGGRGHLECRLKGYEPCHNAEEVINAAGYDPEADLENPAGSVFCAHGAGFVVPWNEVRNYMHVDAGFYFPWERRQAEEEEELLLDPGRARREAVRRQSATLTAEEEKELEEIFERTYKRPERKKHGWERSRRRENDAASYGAKSRSYGSGGDLSESTSASKGMWRGNSDSKRRDEKEYLLVDGYNIIFAWPELKELADKNLDGARGRLMDVLCNYQGFRKMTLILVFDAYKVPGNPGDIQKYHNIYVVYTKEAETADQYIEKTVHEIGRKHKVTVATSDALEQVIVLGQGAERMSAAGLWEDINLVNQEIRKEHLTKLNKDKNYLFDYLPEELAELLEEVRLGKKQL